MPIELKTEKELTLPSSSPALRSRAPFMDDATYLGPWKADPLIRRLAELPETESEAENVGLRGFLSTFSSHAGSWPTVSKELLRREGKFHIRLIPESCSWATAKERKDYGSDVSDADQLLSRAVTHDTESLWREVRSCVEEEGALEQLQVRFGEFLGRHGENGVRALSAILLGRLPSSEAAWLLIRMIGEADDVETVTGRRDLLAAALESRDAGLRYAAASALGEFGDFVSLNALRRRLLWEKNESVRRIIKAELRG